MDHTPPRKQKLDGRKQGSEPRGSLPRRPPKKGNAGLSLRKVPGGGYALFAPECACDRVEDIEEVHSMLAGDELEIARDELLYLVADCGGFLEAHNLLGMIALEEGDLPVARGHFGFAYETGLKALPKGFSGKLDSFMEYNREFFEAGRGLARCLVSQDKRKEALEILQTLARFDPSETTVQALISELKGPDAAPHPAE